MKRSTLSGLAILVSLLTVGSVLAAGMMHQGMARRHQGMMVGIPKPYNAMRNPLPASKEIISEGEQLYQTYCASCHGKQGYGDGPAGMQLSPRPSNLNQLMRMRRMASDSYLIWTISEGGKQFNTAMPAFKETLSEKDRWKIIHFLKNL